MLSDVDLRHCLETGELVIDPITDPDVQIQPASVDLRLSPKLFVQPLPNGLPPATLDPRDSSTFNNYLTPYEIPDVGGYRLNPGEFALGSTAESVTVAPSLIARIEGRSSLGRLGLMIHVTAGFIDPGWEGPLTLEIYNLNNRPIILYPNMRVAQLAVQRLQTPAERPYGVERGSKYSQSLGPVLCRLCDDKEMQT
jgi:dCTP deaminase